jgi:hypothetical protein
MMKYRSYFRRQRDIYMPHWLPPRIFHIPFRDKAKRHPALRLSIELANYRN